MNRRTRRSGLATSSSRSSAHRRTLAALGASLFASMAFAYGCGDSSVTEPGAKDGGATDDGITIAPDGAIVGPDGEVVVPDSSVDAPGDAPTESSLDGGRDADATADADADADPPDPPGPLAATYVDYDVNHVLIAGQSNAVASGGRPQNTLPLNTTAFTNAQPYTNIMFDTGVMTSRNCNGSGCPSANYVEPVAFAPLLENDAFFGGGDRVETAGSALANEVSYLATTAFEFGVRPTYPGKHDVLISNHGRSGNTYWCLRKGGCNYKPASEIKAFDEAIKQVQAGKRLATLDGKSYVVRAVATIHGESDHYGYQDNANNHPEFPLAGTNGVANRVKEYDDALIEWQEDYEAMVKGITGQAEGVPLFVSGVSGWTGSTAIARVSKLANYQLSAAVRAPGKVVYVAPGYIFDAAVRAGGALECLHYSLQGQQEVGEYFAKVYTHVVFKGLPWEPVRPINITRAANVITVQFHVPVPPLAFDTTRVASIANMGFDFVEDGVVKPITSVALAGADSVTITLAATPGAGTKLLRYAQNQPIPGCIGPGVKSGGGARGNVRDSDATASRSGYPLYNWSAPFENPVP